MNRYYRIAVVTQNKGKKLWQPQAAVIHQSIAGAKIPRWQQSISKWPCGNYGNRPLVTCLQLGPHGTHGRFVRAELFPPGWALQNLIALHHGGPQVLVQLEHENAKNVRDLDNAYKRVTSRPVTFTVYIKPLSKVCLHAMNESTKTDALLVP